MPECTRRQAHDRRGSSRRQPRADAAGHRRGIRAHRHPILRAALVRLGFGPCDHMVENHQHPERFALWDEALRRKTADEPIDWRPLLDGFQAIVDWPGAYFWRELTAAHPEAKVILTVRDPERWYDSVQATIFSVMTTIPDGSRDIIFTRTFNGRSHRSRALPGRLCSAQSRGARDDCPGSAAGL